MGRFKIKKADLHIDMTPMSDVMVLLLTFFMLTATFVKPEPIQVQTPGSVSDVKIPEQDILTVFISAPEKSNPNAVPEIFISIDNYQIAQQIAENIRKQPECNTIPQKDVEAFKESQSIKVKIGEMVPDRGNMDDATTNSQFREFIKYVRSIYNGMNKEAADDQKRNLRIAIKSDKATPYSTIKLVMNSLQDIQENRYNLLTELKNRPTE